MWLSDRGRNRPGAGYAAEVGTVTLEGDPAGVYLDGERRALPLYGPGGYCWRPVLNQEALVLKTGRDGERPCVAGVRCGGAAANLAPGEVLLTNGDGSATLWLRRDGSVAVTGTNMTFNGRGIMLAPETPDGA